MSFNLKTRHSHPELTEHKHTLSRTKSIESENFPAFSTQSPLTEVSPDPAYIAVSAASQIVTSEHESFFQTLCDEGIVKHGSPCIMLTPGALKLINQFLDYLLWSFLSTARSTSMKALRPAVAEVLRSKLAREAIEGADAELHEYLGDNADEDLFDIDSEDFELEKAWKKTRFRCMVYSSLGDMEEDDEDVYTRDSQSSTNGKLPVSPAVAIFLTSILEFIGEQTLLHAGQATVTRFSHARISAATAAEEGEEPELLPVDRPMVEELDAEKVALNTSLGRMWRQWRKTVRSPDSARAPSREAFSRRGSQRASRRSSAQSLQSMRDVIDNDHNLDHEETSRPTSAVKEMSITKSLDNNTFPAVPSLALRRLGSDEKLPFNQPLPLTPILETPSVVDSEGRKRLTLTLGTEIAEDEGTPFLVPEKQDWRPSSMPTERHSFPLIPEENEIPDRPRTPTLQRPRYSHGRKRSNSLPLPGISPDSPDFDPRSYASQNRVKIEIPSVKTISSIERLSSPTDREDLGGFTDVETNYTTDGYDTDTFSIHQPTSPKNLYFRRQSMQILEAQTIKILTGSPQPGLKSVMEGGGFREADEEEETTDNVMLSSVVRDALSPSGTEADELERNTIARERRRRSKFYIPTIVTQNEDSAHDAIHSTQELKELVNSAMTDEIPIPERSLSRGLPMSPVTPSLSPSSPLSASGASASMESLSRSISTHSLDKSSLEPRGYVRTQSREKSPTMALPERAGVRQWTPPATPELSRGKRSASFSKVTFHKPTGSISSQTSSKSKLKKKLAGRPTTSDGRASRQGGSDDDSVISETHSTIVSRMDEKQKSFEELIQSGATLQYTLTPETLMKMDVPTFKGGIERSRTATVDLAEFLQESGSHEPTQLPARKSSLAKSRTQSIETADVPDIPQFITVAGETMPLSAVTLGDTYRVDGGIHPESGPTSPISTPPIITPKSSRRPSAPYKAQTEDKIEPIDSVGFVKSGSSHKRFQPREAIAPVHDEGTTALIDFFRSTSPPKDGNDIVSVARPTQPMITLATTSVKVSPPVIDSEKLPAKFDRETRPRQDSLSSSQDVTSTRNRSYPSSYASQTELIKKSESISRVDFAPQVTSITQGVALPARKQSRQRDPYAIDSDEEDEDTSFAVPKSTKKHNESLMDFLNNVPPPPNLPSGGPFILSDKDLNKKASGKNLIDRFRSEKTVSPPRTATSTISKTSINPLRTTTSYQHNSLPVLPKMSPQIGFAASITETIRQAPYRPLPVKEIPYGYVEPQSNPIRNPNTKSTVKRPLAEARGARAHTESMDGLADFLRYTGPPPTLEHIRMPVPPSMTKYEASIETPSNKSKWKMSRGKNKRVAV